MMKSILGKAIAFCTSHTVLVQVIGFVLATIIITTTPLMNVLLGFLIVGRIPGASRTVPYWMMMVGYVLVITAVVTYSLETMFRKKKSTPAKTTVARNSRRRYSHS